MIMKNVFFCLFNTGRKKTGYLKKKQYKSKFDLRVFLCNIQTGLKLTILDILYKIGY